MGQYVPIAIIKALRKRWDPAAAAVLADWLEETGFKCQAKILRNILQEKGSGWVYTAYDLVCDLAEATYASTIDRGAFYANRNRAKQWFYGKSSAQTGGLLLLPDPRPELPSLPSLPLSLGNNSLPQEGIVFTTTTHTGPLTMPFLRRWPLDPY